MTVAVQRNERSGLAVAGRALLFLVLLSVLSLITAALLWAVQNQSQQRWQDPERITASLAGDYFRLGSADVTALRGFSADHFSLAEQDARDLAARQLSLHLDSLFSGVEARLPAFADWYYSLSGEYARLGMLALSWLGLRDGDYVAQQAASMLFPEREWEGGLQLMELQLAEQLAVHDNAARDGWLAGLTARLASQQIPAPLQSRNTDTSYPNSLPLDPLLLQLIDQERSALQNRMQLSTMVAGTAVAGPALWRAASMRATSRTGAAAAARAGSRGAARAGTAAVSGATVCAPGGPAALGCAAVAGAAAWLASDLILLRVDEALNREQMLETLSSSMQLLREELELQLQAAYEEQISAHYGAVQSGIDENFTPLRSTAERRSL